MTCQVKSGLCDVFLPEPIEIRYKRKWLRVWACRSCRREIEKLASVRFEKSREVLNHEMTLELIA
jgi:ribosomal protein L37AE/L43A